MRLVKFPTQDRSPFALASRVFLSGLKSNRVMQDSIIRILFVSPVYPFEIFRYLKTK